MNYAEGCFVGRIWDHTKGGPCLVKIKDGFVFDITSKEIPTMRDLLELKNVQEYLDRYVGEKVISIKELFELSLIKTSVIKLSKEQYFYSTFFLITPCLFAYPCIAKIPHVYMRAFQIL